LLLESIRERLLTLPPQTVVYPGHGPASTVGAEARTNPFLT
jgi:glyoxylase-like metal-dependent hydrolase (beta-lactamase superfamily II)